uniref:ornithine decarboxylase n=1 Tax=Periophthalmus magnuspinnatus TaxID=409849 RepID=A0A3B3Z9V4_9GOBI
CKGLQTMDSSGIEVLDSRSKIETFIDEKIKERTSVVCIIKRMLWGVLVLLLSLSNVQYIYSRPFYAVKCNPTAEVLRTLVALGTGFDCASKREIEKVLSLGVTPDRIIYANTTKPQSHIRYGSAAGVDMMTFDCEEELLKISTSHSKANSRASLKCHWCQFPCWKFVPRQRTV